MVLAHAQNNRKLIPMSWLTHFVPVCQVILWKTMGEVQAFVTLWNEGGVVSTISLHRLTRSLQGVADTSRVPPSCIGHAIGRERRTPDAQFLIDGPALPALAWQAQRRCANVPEFALRKLVERKKCKALPPCRGNHRRTLRPLCDPAFVDRERRP